MPLTQRKQRVGRVYVARQVQLIDLFEAVLNAGWQAAAGVTGGTAHVAGSVTTECQAQSVGMSIALPQALHCAAFYI